MIILRIEHQVMSYDGWKKAFESDPVKRKASGVREYKIYRPVDDANFVILDLCFETLQEAEAMLAKLRTLWNKVEGQVIMKAETRIMNVVESVRL